MGSFSTAPVTFNGSSQYASSLQQVITRSVALASVPLQQLQNEQNFTANKISAAQSLQTVLTKLNTALTSLSSSSSNNTSATVSDDTVVHATASAGALPGTYTVAVSDPGSSSTAMSADGLATVTDPSKQTISTGGPFTLTVGTNTYTFSPSSNTLDSLVAAINASGATVQATIINIGGNSQPDYRIALQDTALASDTLQLSDGSTDLLTQLNTGGEASYTVNGQPAAGISSTSSTVTVAPGLSVTLQGVGTATIQVALNSTSISNSLSAFVTAFNAVQAELQKSFGQSAGALSGDSTVFSASQAVSAIAGYPNTGSGSVQSLADLGIEFTKTGTLTFDATKVAAMSSTQLNDALTFLGTPTTSGFLKTATDTLNGLLDPSKGVVSSEITDLQKQYTDESSSIQAQQAKINLMQTNLIQQMNAADAAIASLEQQTSFLTQLFATTNANKMAGG